MEDSVVIQAHIPCPDCGSSDAMCEYSDGHTFCFSCDTRHEGTVASSRGGSRKLSKETIPLESLTLDAIRARGITQETCHKYGYYKAKVGNEIVQVACYYDDDGTIIGQKLRTKNKDFSVVGHISDRFFGQHLWPGGGKKLIITEGEIDCLTVSQIQGNKYPVVSIPNGAKSAKKVFKNQMEWLETFEQVIVMFDMDERGREAVKDVEGILKPGKLYVAALPLKDPNECLLNDQADAVVKAIWNAKMYKPDGIINGNELWERVNNKQNNIKSLPWPWKGDLQRLTKGVRLGELLLVTAGTGVGKSTIFREMAYHFGVAMEDPIKVGMVFLEEQNEDTALSLMSIHVKKRLNLVWDEIPEEERKDAFEATMGTGRFVFYDHFGSLDSNNLINKIRYMAKAEGCKFIFIDHISIAISGMESNNERKDIDILMTNLVSLTQELGVGIGVICHLKKTDGAKEAFEEGGRVSLDDLRGSGALKQLSFTVVAGERNQQEEDEQARNLIRLRLLKCRFTGKTGIAGHLYYNEDTGRLETVDRVSDIIGENHIDLGDQEGSDF